MCVVIVIQCSNISIKKKCEQHMKSSKKCKDVDGVKVEDN